MIAFTVVGYWSDSLQRFSAYVDAMNPEEAEEICMQQHPGVAICAVFTGRQVSVDAAEHVRLFDSQTT